MWNISAPFLPQAFFERVMAVMPHLLPLLVSISLFVSSRLYCFFFFFFCFLLLVSYHNGLTVQFHGLPVWQRDRVCSSEREARLWGAYCFCLYLSSSSSATWHVHLLAGRLESNCRETGQALEVQFPPRAGRGHHSRLVPGYRLQWRKGNRYVCYGKGGTTI